MFGLFKRKTEKERLHEQYRKLMAEAYELSTTDRAKSDQKVEQADVIMQRIEMLESPKSA